MSQELADFFQKDEIEAIARDTKFVQRKSQLGGFEFLDLLVHTRSNQLQMSLNQMASSLSTRHGVTISKQAVDERFNGFSVEFFRVVLERILQQELCSFEDLFTDFDRVLIKDSTSFQLPEHLSEIYPGSGGSGSKASIRIQFEYDLINGEVSDLSLHAFNDSDIENAKSEDYNTGSNCLYIRDLGYVSNEILRNINKSKNYYINRLKPNIAVFEKKGGLYKKIDFSEILSYMNKNGTERLEREVYVGKDDKFKTRLIILKMPEDAINERLRKLNANAKKRGSSVSKESKSRVHFNLFITNVEENRLSTKEIWDVYRLRWQIELIFKVWKSVGEIDIVKKVKRHRFESFLLARLIWLSINWNIFWVLNNYYWDNYKQVLSIYKVFSYLSEHRYELHKAVKSTALEICKFINRLLKIANKYFLLEKRKGHVSSIEILLSQSIKKQTNNI